jgi:ABC-2 type transport system permease protein
MMWTRLVRAELRKLTTTRMVWGFVAVLVALAAVNAAVVMFGTDMDGSKAFIATAGDQRSLVAFAANALLGASLFGAVAVAREYAHGTVIPTFLSAPRRHRAVLAQLIAVLVFGALLGFVGAGLTVVAVALALPTTQYGFLMSAGAVAQVLAASAFAAAVGAVLGAGIGAVVRNTGGAVAGVVLVLMIAPPLIVQLAHGSGSWMPAALANVLSGVTDDVAAPAAVLAMLAWAVVPAVIGLLSVQRRDVV